MTQGMWTDIIDLRAFYGRALGKELFDVIVKFADYAFNKAHSAGYGVLSYWTAYLKANYPAEFMAALLTPVVMATLFQLLGTDATVSAIGRNSLPSVPSSVKIGK